MDDIEKLAKEFYPEGMGGLNESAVNRYRAGYLAGYKAAQSKKWKYCPECGCNEIVNENLVGKGYRVCKNCGQEWWVDIDYSDEVQGNLKRLKAAQSKGRWTDEDLEKAFEAGMSFQMAPIDNPSWEDYFATERDYKTQLAIYKNYPNINASKEEMNEMRKLK